MKVIKRELESIAKNLKALTKKVESIAQKLAKMEAATAKKAKAPVRAAKKPAAKAKKIVRSKAKKVIATDAVFAVIRRSRKGVNTATLKEKTGFNETKVRNVIFRLKKQGKITTKTKGVYIAA
ncbi:MAG: hypothetical protein JRK53_12650 [Deltaproteobacteria bacterium]|nr:hypothetical protein [Deltaproteobacteria bacterium]MBW1818154.1 hypothetical protein [Deltaproteobacteria bacterium]MBW2285116.1 hypothetical protein [Deltaproteobacteria bacterium]